MKNHKHEQITTSKLYYISSESLFNAKNQYMNKIMLSPAKYQKEGMYHHASVKYLDFQTHKKLQLILYSWKLNSSKEQINAKFFVPGTQEKKTMKHKKM